MSKYIKRISPDVLPLSSNITVNIYCHEDECTKRFDQWRNNSYSLQDLIINKERESFESLSS